jgi:L-ascorbate metabolism protein UlaG (beta-lactamase superfamily)
MKQEKSNPNNGLRIQWLGHACFLVTSSDGTRVLTDPFDKSVGYPVPAVEADVVSTSHSHFDHNSVSVVKGSPKVVRNAGESAAAGISFLGVSSYHDDAGGAKRGRNIIFVWEMDGMRLAHLGDLGHTLTDDQVAEIGKVDILLIPVGGTYTIDAKQATKVVQQLSPKLVFPMHYKTDAISFPIAGVDEFLAGKDNVERAKENFVLVKELPEKTKIVVLNYMS